MTAEDVVETAVSKIFVGLNAPAALPGLRTIIRSWKPDLIVRESMEFGASVAAAEAGIPTARVASTNSQAEAQAVSLGHPTARRHPSRGRARTRRRSEPAGRALLHIVSPLAGRHHAVAGRGAPFRVR